ncbi:hypothetical protein [Cerasicoccus maritimus]|uniref:hypothetical protein n=1 Tax=Cerasicoccus maritimus TaxID=490089 RepID=UPI002852B7F8|nr:hypothetical protein [Cerasicoccus maritimus]
MIKLNTKNEDGVINGIFLTGNTSYGYSIQNIYPLINRLHIQRKIQNEKFYKRLETDLTKGCIMPPLTLALVDDKNLSNASLKELESLVNKNIRSAFVLDGIQRLNTLKRVYDRGNLDIDLPIFLNIIICHSKDNLLYRMITLNNGQKPMTARHQIEMLAANIYDFKKLGINIVTEKESAQKRPRDAFKKSDIISAYIAFLSGSTNIESAKIIESKMDELIARQIIESKNTSSDIEFGDVIKEIARFTRIEYLMKWFKNLNNLIGFAVGVKDSLREVKSCDTESFLNTIKTFEKAFSDLDVSKIKLSRERRKLTEELFSDFITFQVMDSDDMLLRFNELD